MDKADVLVFPTLSDGFGLVQLEAMESGLPVISTACCGNVVQDGVNGLVVKPSDSLSLLEALLKLQGDRELYRRLFEGALIRAGEYLPDSHHKLFMSII